MPSCKGDKKAKKKQQAASKKATTTSASSSKPTEATESTTRASSTTQRANSNNNYNLRRKTTSTTTTTQAPPTTSRQQVNVQPDNINQHLTPELLAAALKLAREQEKSTTLNSGPSDDHLFQLLQLVKSLGGVDKVQELLNNYNYNKKPLGVGPVDFVNPPVNTEIHSHNHHMDSSRLIRPAHENEGPTILQPNDYAAPQRQNSRGTNRQPTTISPFLNPSYVTPRRQVEPQIGSSPVPDYPNLPSLINENGNANNDLDIPRNSQPRQRRPQRIETTTESIPADQATSRTRSPFSFVYNEPMLRNNAPVAPANSIYENVDESLLAITEPPQRSRSRQRGRTSATTSVIIEPGQPIIDGSVAREPQRPRIRGGNRANGNSQPRENIGNLREPNNVDGFFLYSTPSRSSTRQPSIVEPVLNIQDKPRRAPSSRSRTSEASVGNVYSVPARVQAIPNERATGVETAPSSSSTRKKKPAKVRISTGFVVNESPASPGVTYDEEADIFSVSIPFNNEPRSIGSRNSERSGRRNSNVNSNPRNSFTHHHSHNVMDSHVINHGPNSIEVPSLNDSPPEPTIISRKPSPIRRRPPQRPHILNNPNAIVEGDYSNQPTTGDLEDPFVRNNHLSTTRGTTLNPFSSYSSSSVGLSSLSSAADHEPTRISSTSSEANNHSPSIHSLADDLESNYNLHSGGGANTDLFNYNNAVGNTSPAAHSHSPSFETSPNDLNTTPYLTTYTTERTIINHSSSAVTEPAISSTVQTTTQSPSTYMSSSLATSPSPSIRGNNLNNLSNSGARRGRPRTHSNQRIVETTPQSIQPKQTPKRVAASAPVTRAPVISNPVTSAPATKPAASAADGEPITWSQADNKVTCNRRGKQTLIFYTNIFLMSVISNCNRSPRCLRAPTKLRPVRGLCPIERLHKSHPTSLSGWPSIRQGGWQM